MIKFILRTEHIATGYPANYTISFSEYLLYFFNYERFCMKMESAYKIVDGLDVFFEEVTYV